MTDTAFVHNSSYPPAATKGFVIEPLVVHRMRRTARGVPYRVSRQRYVWVVSHETSGLDLHLECFFDEKHALAAATEFAALPEACLLDQYEEGLPQWALDDIVSTWKGVVAKFIVAGRAYDPTRPRKKPEGSP